jgi:hypothetical protein
MKSGFDTMRRIAAELQPTWSDEQFDAHWLAFIKLRQSVSRGRRKQSAKKAIKL